MPSNSGLKGIGHIPYKRDNYWKSCCTQLGYECPTKSQMYKILGYIPLKTMNEMHKSRATHRIILGGNRSGKSFAAAWEAIPYILWVNTLGWIVSANYDMAEEIVNKIMLVLSDVLKMERVNTSTSLSPTQFNYNLKNHMLSVGSSGSRIQLKSAENPDSMHAVPVDYIIIDEAALIPYTIYDTRLVPRLVDSGGWILAVGTFEWLQNEWFEEYYDLGQMENDLDIKSWRHPTEDNYHIYTASGGETAEEIAAKYKAIWSRIVEDNKDVRWPLRKGDQIVIWNIDRKWLEQERKRIPLDIFAARYEAKKSTDPYLVYPKWDTSKFVDKRRAAFDPELPVYLAIDPGGTYAVAALQMKHFDDVGDKNELTRGQSLCIIDEIYFQTTVTTQEVYNVASHREWWPNVNRVSFPHWDKAQGAIDIYAKEQKRAWEILGSQDPTIKNLFLRAKKVNIQAGIQTLQHYIDTESVYVNPKCTFWNMEMRKYHYPPPTISKLGSVDPRKKANPEDSWNHLIKAVTYFLVTQYGVYGRSNNSPIVSLKELRRSKGGQVVKDDG